MNFQYSTLRIGFYEVEPNEWLKVNQSSLFKKKISSYDA